MRRALGIRLALVLGAFAALHPGPVGWAGSNCAVCGQAFKGGFVLVMTDRWEGTRQLVCDACARRPQRCALCGLPVSNDPLQLPDGRHYCERDRRLAIIDPAEALRLVQEARLEIDRFFSRFLTLPHTNIQLRFEDQIHMDQLMRRPGFERQCPYLYGYTRSEQGKDGRWRHDVRILSALPRSQLLSTYVHEVTHAWLKEVLPSTRALAQGATEGFCELLACLLMEQWGEKAEVERIRRNTYTEGQIDLFRAAHSSYDLGRIIEWMKYGRSTLLGADIDAIRAIDSTMAPAAPVGPASPPAVLVLPEEPVLLGLSGQGQRRLALVNNATLSEGEAGKVRLGTNVVLLRCLRIGTNSVRIQWVESGEERDLPLQAPRAP